MRLEKRLWAVLAAVLIVFHVLAFVIPFVHTAVFWIAYACTLIMFSGFAYTAKRVLKNDFHLDSLILGWPLLRVACVATVVQLIVFFAFAAAASVCPVSVTVIVEVILLAAAFIGLLVKDTTEEVVRNVEQTVPDMTSAIKKMRAQAKALLKNNANPALQASLEKLNDALRFADPVSNEATAQVDAIITEKMSAVQDDTDIAEILKLINHRSELCKYGKR